jgi:hypothetical protein
LLAQGMRPADILTIGSRLTISEDCPIATGGEGPQEAFLEATATVDRLALAQPSSRPPF